MKMLTEVKLALLTQKNNWLTSTVNWADFDTDFEAGNKKHREAVINDFLEENDVVDFFEPENTDEIGIAEELRTDCLAETLQAMDLN